MMWNHVSRKGLLMSMLSRSFSTKHGPDAVILLLLDVILILAVFS